MSLKRPRDASLTNRCGGTVRRRSTLGVPMARGKGQFYMKSIDPATTPSSAKPISVLPSGPVATVWVPRPFLTSKGVNLAEFREHLNAQIEQRGMILYDGQLLTAPMPEDPEVIFDGDHHWNHPPAREWSQVHHDYFGLKNPYQPIEDGDAFTYSHVMWRAGDSYLGGDERIVAILHGKTDDYDFSCPCHFAGVVYTTRHRLICMSCGALHAVLLKPLEFRPHTLLTAKEWSDLFDDDGPRRDEQVALAVLDFRDVEHAPMLWVTDQWLDAVHRFIFFARSSEEVIWEAIRGTEQDPTIFEEAGWTSIPQAPAPATQLSDDSIDVDLLQNAALAMAEGAASFAKARAQPEHLVHAIPHLFRSLELMLKAKLQELSATALDDRPRFATVIKRLKQGGVHLTQIEHTRVDSARKLRNKLQHGTATFNHRAGLTVCRNLIIFLDSFAKDELNLWIGDAIPSTAWQELIKIPDVARTAAKVVAAIIQDVRRNADATVTPCECCGQETMIRPHPNTGASCAYCRYVPTIK